MEENNKALIPGAIIVAGLLIAGAVFYNGEDGNTNSETPTNIGNEPVSIIDQEISEEDYVLGDHDAEIFIVEYSDLDCPYCQSFHTSMHQVIDEYDGKVAWVYRHLPLDDPGSNGQILHPDAGIKAEASECVGELGGNSAFWSYIDILFERNEGADDLGSIAQEVGIDLSAFEECVESDRKLANVQEDKSSARRSGGNGTPYSVIVVDGKSVSSINGARPFEGLSIEIDSLLE